MADVDGSNQWSNRKLVISRYGGINNDNDLSQKKKNNPTSNYTNSKY